MTSLIKIVDIPAMTELYDLADYTFHKLQLQIIAEIFDKSFPAYNNMNV